MSERLKFLIILIVAVVIGLFIAWVDTRPHWDDTGITVAMVFLSSAVLGSMMRRHAWLLALALGVWIPLVNIIQFNNYGSVFAIVVAFAGAYAGAFLRRTFFSDSHENKTGNQERI
jgi:hypothetical protein